MRDHHVKLGRQARRLADRNVRPMRTIVVKLRRKLGDGAKAPTYIFTEPRVGYRMGQRKEQVQPRLSERGALPASTARREAVAAGHPDLAVVTGA